jgi:PTH1 family peptidyl-tRNA hydrolase
VAAGRVLTGRALIVGLGNPGREYARHRHNIGFQCVERYASERGLRFGRVESGALVAAGLVAGRRVILAKPQRFMNLSGRPVAALARFHQIALSDLLVLYDELDLPFGVLRLKPEGGAGGHNGMRSLIQHLGTQDFPRLRIGIGRPPGRMDPADFVLQRFSREEEAQLDELGARAADAIDRWLETGIEAAMNVINRRPEGA